MKTKKLLLTCLLLLGVVSSKPIFAQKGTSCDSAKVLTYPINNSVTSYTNSYYWFKVTLDTGNFSIKITNLPSAGNIKRADVFTGTCSSLSLINTDSLVLSTDTFFYVNIRNSNNNTPYYVKLYNSGGNVSFNKTMAQSVKIVGQIGFCPGQSIKLYAFPFNPIGTQTFTWQPGGSNANPLTITPTNTTSPTTYTLYYNDNGGTLTTTINIFPLAPDQCKNCEQVQNGHFEWYDSYATSYGNILDTYDWTGANMATTDYFNANYPIPFNVPVNGLTSNTPAHSGNGYSGLATYVSVNPNYREYIQNKLICPLVTGQIYNISFYATLPNQSAKASNNIGAFLSALPVYTPSLQYISGVAPQINSASVINFSTNWTQVSGNISGNNQQYITIGNFYNDANTTTVTSVSTNSIAANNYSYYYIDDVSVVPVPPTLSSSSNTVSCGCASTITLTATGSPSVYTIWSNGINTYSGSIVSVPCPTATTIYTCSVNLPCSNCSPLTNTIMVSVIPPTLSVNSTTICVGSSSTLTATGASTYTWNPGALTGNTISVSPTVTTIYTVTGTDTLGCVATNTVLVNVISAPTITASPTSICSGASSTLTASGATTYTWLPSGTTGNSVIVSPTVTTVYTVTGSNGACTSTQTVLVTVNSSYCCQTPVITFTTGTISSQTTAVSYGAVLIAVNGTLTINTPNFTFTKTNIRMAPNAKIIIAPSCSVSLSGAHLFSCDYMWEGIEMQNNSQLITSKSLVTSPTLDDANIGIYANANSMTNPPSIGLNYLIMSKNHIGIKIENYTGAAPYPFGMGAVTIQGNVATSFSPSTILKPYLSTSGTIYFPTTQYGVNLVNVSEAIVGSFTGYRNNFKKMQYGIRMVKSNAKIIRNDFLDFGTAYDNKAIWVAGDVALSPPLGSIPLGYGTKHRFSVGVGTSNYCTFQNVKYGIFSDSCMTAYIETNTFKDINGTGISINRSNFYRGFEFYDDMPYLGFYDRDTVSINTNTMIPLSANANVMQNGITMNDNYYLSSLVYNNSINLKPATNIWSTGVSISHASTNYNSSYLTFNNLINGTGNVGIQELNDAALFATSGNTRGIASNTITLGTGYCGGWLPIPNMGIYSINSPYAVIAENIIDESSLGGAPACLQGIVISNGQQDYIGCNLVKNTNIGFSINNNNLNSVFRGNVMNTATTGLKLSSGTMGNIGATNDAAQNEWYNISTNHTFVSNSFVLANIYYDGGVGRIPSINGNTAGSIPFTPVITNTTTLGCTQHYKGGNNSKINPKDDNDALVAAIIQDNVQFSDYNHGLLWEHKNGILNLLKDSLLDNTKPLFAQFRQQNTNSKLGKINNLMHSLGNYSDVLQNKNTYLQALNSIGAATNVVEQNYKTFIAEYLTNVVGVSSVSGSTYDMMKDLALKCPYTDGASVYHARALMKVLGDNEPYYNSCEATQESNAAKSATANTPQDALQNVLVYPNPNSGTFSIAYAFENNTNTFTLVDVLGKVVLSKTLTGTVGIETITTQDVLSGIYFYHVTDNNGKQTHTGKLMINK